MLFNIRLPLNFNSPYKAKSIIEFWRRWHMTLSAFLRDYLYVPLGGGRNGSVSRYLNLLVTMLLGGLWHGAGWNFLVWGGVHGAYLMINHLWRNVSSSGEKSISGAGTIVCVGLTFAAVVVAWVPFRAADLQTTLHMWAGMFGINGVTLSKSLQTMLPQWIGQFATYDGLMPLVELNALELIFFIAVGLTIVWGMPNTQELISSCQSNSDSARKPTIISWRLGRIQAVILGGLFSLSLLMISRQSEFLYFQF